MASGAILLLSGGVPLLAHISEVGGRADVGRIPLAHDSRVQPARPDAGFSPPAALAPPPVHLRFPRLGIDAPVLPVSVGVDGLLGVPDNARQLGWWSDSGRPGIPSGSVVIDGHVDSAALGPGALFRLREAQPGDEVVLVNAAGGSTPYTVVARHTYAKTSLPVAEVFATDFGHRLVLVTCGGSFDQRTRHYADNVVVYAVPR